jgi:uncharacterized protein involved in exopolysaccharide biosynthesis/Mrp family chromosome partitioning ATPase
MEGSVTNRGRAGAPQPPSIHDQMHGEYGRAFFRAHDEVNSPARQVMITLSRSKWTLLLCALAGAVLMGLVGLTRPVLYEATTQLIVEVPANNGAAVTPDAMSAAIDDHLTIMLSRSHLQSVIAALGKEADKSLLAGLRKKGAPSGLVSALTGKAAVWADALRVLIGRPAVAPPPAAPASETYALTALKGSLRVGQEARSRVFSAAYTDRDPVAAARIVNSVAQVYVEQLRQQALAYSRRELASVDERLPRLQSELTQATRKVEDYRLSNGVGNQANTDAAANEISQLRQLMSAAKANLAAARNKLGAMAGGQDAEAGRLDNAVRVYEAQIASLEERVSSLKAEAVDMAERLSGLRAFELERDAAVGRYNELLARRESLLSHIAAAAPGVSILSAASPPADPKTMSALFLLPPGAILFALLGGALAILRRSSDSTLRSEAEAESALGIAVAGMIPVAGRLTASRLQRILSGQPKTVYRRATSSILFSLASYGDASRLPRVLLVTASTRRDHKTELAWSMALTAARIGARVLFLDFDAQDARLTASFRKSFGDSRINMNIADLARGNCAFEEAVETMPQIGVDFIAAPRASEDLLAFLSTFDVDAVVGRLRETYGVIIVNGPAGIDGPEAALLASWADAALFAVAWGKTPRTVARAALDRVASDSGGQVPVSSVLTATNLKKHAGYRFGDAGDLMSAKA